MAKLAGARTVGSGVSAFHPTVTRGKQCSYYANHPRKLDWSPLRLDSSKVGMAKAVWRTRNQPGAGELAKSGEAHIHHARRWLDSPDTRAPASPTQAHNDDVQSYVGFMAAGYLTNNDRSADL
jgi:hypothetical protein